MPYYFLHVFYLFTILHNWLFLLIITLNSEFCCVLHASSSEVKITAQISLLNKLELLSSRETLHL